MSSRSDHPTLGYLPPSGSSTANTSPTEPNALRSPFGITGGLTSGKMAGTTRSGAGSPSQFSPGGANNGFVPPGLAAKTSRPTPSPSPFKTPPPLGDLDSNAALLSRLRAGSMPQRSQFTNGAGPFGPSVFSSNWASGRE